MAALGWLLNLDFAGGEAVDLTGVVTQRFTIVGSQEDEFSVTGTDDQNFSISGA